MKNKICFVSFLFLGLLMFFSSASASYTFTLPTLRQGSSGAEVVQLQTFLNTGGYATPALVADGSFGPATAVAVKAWQSSVSLTADGVVGSQSMAILNGGISAGTGNYPSGCNSNTGYSITTGQSCNVSSATTNLPIGCSSTSVYSTTTGQLCSQSSSVNNQTNSSSLENETAQIEAAAPGLGAAIIDGCLSGSQYSSVTGQSCVAMGCTITPTVTSNSSWSCPVNNSANTQTSTNNTTNANTPWNGSNFTKIQLSQYAENPSAYMGQPVQFSGMVLKFLPEGGAGGATNFVSMEDLATDTQVMVEVDNASLYDALVNKVTMPAAFLEVYGVGAANQNFTNNYGATLSTPVLNFSGADSCGIDYSCGTLEHLVP